MANAFETILVTWLAFAFLPERPTRPQGGTDGSNPVSSRRESRANLKTTLWGRGTAGLKSPVPAGITEILRTSARKRLVREDHQSGRGEVLGRIFSAARGEKAPARRLVMPKRRQRHGPRLRPNLAEDCL